MRKVLLAGCLVSLIAAGIGQAGAYFNAQTSVPDNVITCGSVEVSCEPTAGALDIPAIAPGMTVSDTLSIKNTGTLGVDVIVTGAKKAGFTALYEALECKVTHGTTALYEGGLAALRTAALVVPAGGTEDLTFEVTLPVDSDDGLQGDYVRMTLYVDAEQVHQ